MGITKDDAFRLNNFAEKIAPSTGVTVTPLGHTRKLVIDTAALAALSIQFPDNPKDGQPLGFYTTSEITTLTLIAGAAPVGTTILNAVTTLAAEGSVEYTYNRVGNQWYRTK